MPDAGRKPANLGLDHSFGQVLPSRRTFVQPDHDKAGRKMRRRYVSIKEVAAKAGVSFQTASKVLNGGNVRVSEETAARIMAVAERLGYRPNTVARSLVQRSTATIGLIAGDITDAALSQFTLAAERTARRNSQAVLVGSLAEGGEDGAAVARMLIERRVDGIIAA